MANRFFNSAFYSMEKNPVFLFAKVAIGATGAPTLDAVNSKGIKSITRTSAGLYVVTFGNATSGVDIYNRRLFCKHQFLVASGNPAAPLMFVVSETVGTTGTMTIQFTAVDGVTATDPASGEQLWLAFQMKNSNAQ